MIKENSVKARDQLATPSQMEDSKTEDQVEILISDTEKEEDSSEAKSKSTNTFNYTNYHLALLIKTLDMLKQEN